MSYEFTIDGHIIHGFPNVIDTQSCISWEINQIEIAQAEQVWIGNLLLMYIVDCLFWLGNV